MCLCVLGFTQAGLCGPCVWHLGWCWKVVRMEQVHTCVNGHTHTHTNTCCPLTVGTWGPVREVYLFHKQIVASTLGCCQVLEDLVDLINDIVDEQQTASESEAEMWNICRCNMFHGVCSCNNSLPLWFDALYRTRGECRRKSPRRGDWSRRRSYNFSTSRCSWETT